VDGRRVVALSPTGTPTLAHQSAASGPSVIARWLLARESRYRKHISMVSISVGTIVSKS